MPKNNQVAEITVKYHGLCADNPVLKSTADALIEFFAFFDPDTIHLQEELLVMYLRGNKMLGIYRHSKGSMESTNVDQRIILATALKIAANGIIIAHNHPTGNLIPSQQDIKVTRSLLQACKLLNLKLLDHLIVTPDRKYCSVLLAS